MGSQRMLLLLSYGCHLIGVLALWLAIACFRALKIALSPEEV